MSKRCIRTLAVLSTAVSLAACGGGDGGGGDGNAAGLSGNASNSDIPAAAQQTVTGLITYLRELVSQSSDTAEPLRLGDAALPTSETDEPVALN